MENVNNSERIGLARIEGEHPRSALVRLSSFPASNEHGAGLELDFMRAASASFRLWSSAGLEVYRHGLELQQLMIECSVDATFDMFHPFASAPERSEVRGLLPAAVTVGRLPAANVDLAIVPDLPTLPRVTLVEEPSPPASQPTLDASPGPSAGPPTHGSGGGGKRARKGHRHR